MRFSLQVALFILLPFAIKTEACTNFVTFSANFPDLAKSITNFLNLSKAKKDDKILNESPVFNNFLVNLQTKTGKSFHAVLTIPKINSEENLSSPSNEFANESVHKTANSLAEITKLEKSFEVPFYACFQKDNISYLISKYNGADLWTSFFNAQNKIEVNPDFPAFYVRHPIFRLKVFKRMAEIVQLIQKHGFVLHNISPASFHIDVENNIVKLQDVGYIRNENDRLPLGNNPFYYDLEKLSLRQNESPEFLQQISAKGGAKQSDIWSLGVTYYAIENYENKAAFAFWKPTSAPETQAVAMRDHVLHAKWINDRGINLCTKNKTNRVCFADVLRGMMYIGRNEERWTIDKIVQTFDDILKESEEIKIEGPVGLNLQELVRGIDEVTLKHHII